MTIEHLRNLQWEQSPIAKIDLIYQALKYTLATEVDNFWENTETCKNADWQSFLRYFESFAYGIDSTKAFLSAVSKNI